jgi:phosphate transport system substrate-binding protein
LLLPAGTVVAGAYRILRPLAEGGMGTVYEAEQLATRARRALKVMHGHFAHDEALRARFIREAHLAASIPSDHVAQVLDAGLDEASGALYIVMELLQGTTLSREVRRRGAFAWPDALEVMRQIAHALGAAHDLSIVHRDLKPANVFLSPSRHASGTVMVKVLDFGIAKAVSGSAESTGALLGTPSWMAPEQTTTDVAVGPQTDVWSFGLLGYLLLTGKHFFPSANLANVTPAVLLREVVFEPIPMASTRATGLERADRLPEGFDGWFARCVDREPSARFPDARVAYEALAELSAPVPGEVVPTFADDPPQPSHPSLARPDSYLAADTGGSPRGSSGSRGAAAFTALTIQETQAGPSDPRRRRAPLVVAGVIGLGGAAIAALLSLRHPAPPVTPASFEAGVPVTTTAPKALIRLHGSNTIGSDLAPALAEAFLRQRTGATVVRRREGQDTIVIEAHDGPRTLESIEVEGHGTATAFQDLAAARCDIGMASRRVHDDEAGDASLASAASEHVIGLDGIAVIVNPTNPVSSLTTTQLAAVFAGGAGGWSDVGGAAGPIAVYALDGRSGTFDTFRHLVLGERPVTADAKSLESSAELSDAVAADARAIGFIGLPYVRSAKPVMIQEGTSMPLLPSPMSVATEDYPLARRLYLYLPLGAPVAARDFVDFALSDAGQVVVGASGFVDLRPECESNAPRCPTCSAEYRDAVRGACRLSIDFRFVRGELDTRALADLQRIASFMRKRDNAARSLVLLGFSASGGPRVEDLARSRQSAATVATQLRARGLNVDVARGLGPEMPVADPATPAGRERNHRVEVWLR